MKIDKKIVVNVVYALMAVTCLTMLISSVASLCAINSDMESAGKFFAAWFFFAIVLAVVVAAAVITLITENRKLLFVSLIAKGAAILYFLIGFIVSLVDDSGIIMASGFLQSLTASAVMLIIGILSFGAKDLLNTIKTKKVKEAPAPAGAVSTADTASTETPPEKP